MFVLRRDLAVQSFKQLGQHHRRFPVAPGAHLQQGHGHFVDGRRALRPSVCVLPREAVVRHLLGVIQGSRDGIHQAWLGRSTLGITALTRLPLVLSDPVSRARGKLRGALGLFFSLLRRPVRLRLLSVSLHASPGQSTTAASHSATVPEARGLLQAGRSLGRGMGWPSSSIFTVRGQV